MPATGTVRYSSLHLHTQILVFIFAVFIAVESLSLWLDWSNIGILKEILANGTVQDAQMQANDNARRLIGSLHGLILLATILIFLAWTWRANRNLPSLNVEDYRYTTLWAVVWWFIPFANLVMPYLVIREIWRASDPGVTDELDWKRSPTQPILPAWWLCWLFAFILRYVAIRYKTLSGSAVQEMLTGAWLEFTATAALVVAAILAVMVLREISRRQEQKHRRLVG